jgi:hypothetical protein
MWFVRRTPTARAVKRWLAWLIAFALASGTSSASFEFAKPRWDSTTQFLKLARDKLGQNRVVLGAQLDWSLLTPEDSVLVMYPQQRLQFTQVNAFLAGGGRVAVLDDFGKGDHVLSRFHIHRHSAPSSPLESLHNNPHLQLARPADDLAGRGSALRHPMTAGIDHVVTNHPAALGTGQDVELTPILTLTDTHGKESLFAVVGVIGDALACGLDDGRPRNERARCGRLFAMADPSVFIDLMMQFDGNRKLAAGLINYLMENDAWGDRRGNLYILANDFTQTGDYGGSGDLERQLDTALDTLAAWLSDAQSEGLPTRLAWLIAVIASLAVAVSVYRSSGSVYDRPTPRYAATPPLLSQGGLIGRAAVLSAESTNGMLVVLELKTAIEEFLRERLSLSNRSSPAEILQAIEKRALLEPARLRRLTEVFRHMGDAERALLGSESARFSAESIKDMRTELAFTQEKVERLSRRTT